MRKYKQLDITTFNIYFRFILCDYSYYIYIISGDIWLLAFWLIYIVNILMFMIIDDWRKLIFMRIEVFFRFAILIKLILISIL